MYMIDDNDARRDPMRDGRMVGKFDDNMIPAMSAWPRLDPGSDDPAGANIATIRHLPKGAHSTTIVNQLLPLEYDWLEVPGPEIRATRCARW